MSTEAQRKANTKYKTDKVKVIRFELYPTDTDIINKLESVPAKATYIKDLIRKDIAN